MVYHGWAFGVREGQMTRAEISERYKEIKHLISEFKWNGGTHYAHNTWTAQAMTEAANQLSSMDVLILADSGNLCFGGESSNHGPRDGEFQRFSGSYNTD